MSDDEASASSREDKPPSAAACDAPGAATNTDAAAAPGPASAATAHRGPVNSSPARPALRPSETKCKRPRHQQHAVGKTVMGQRTSRYQAPRAARETVEELHRQLAAANAQILTAENKAKRARQDMMCERTNHSILIKTERKMLADKVKVACAAAIQSECSQLANRVLALQAQVEADITRHHAERAKFTADEALHLQNAARLRQERDDLREGYDNLKRCYDTFRTRVLSRLPGAQADP
jgi:hypothetical protein